mmetsp:Transcript_19726/g.41105  ORF Transcript_19726/g.41105 Transcript_19726/m.41105 type:complete len:99 (-) Transcript_19726:1425-1721(-)
MHSLILTWEFFKDTESKATPMAKQISQKSLFLIVSFSDPSMSSSQTVSNQCASVGIVFETNDGLHAESGGEEVHILPGFGYGLPSISYTLTNETNRYF